MKVCKCFGAQIKIEETGHWDMRILLQLRGDCEESGYTVTVHNLPLSTTKARCASG